MKNSAVFQLVFILVCGNVLLVSGIIGIQTSHAATYYVSPSGNDGNPGTLSNPWRTIQKAAQTLVAGDTVYIRGGTYIEQIRPANSGNSGGYITYENYQGEQVTVDGQNTIPAVPGPDAGLFELANRSYIRIMGLSFINSQGAGILANNCSFCDLEGNSTFNTWSSGIGVWESSNINITNNSIRRACQGNGDTQECLTVAQTQHFVVANNHVWDALVTMGGGEGIDVKQSSQNGVVYGNHVHDLSRVGIYIDAYDEYLENIEVYNNLVHSAGDGVALSVEIRATGRLRNIRVYNNIIYNNLLHGIIVTDYYDTIPAEGDGPKQDIYIINNTVYNNGYDIPDWGGGITITSRNPNNRNIVVRNNICADNNQWQIMRNTQADPTLTINHNLIYGNNSYSDGQEAATNGNSSVAGPPDFVNATSADFHLESDSPAIDAGDPTEAPSFDYESNARPQGSQIDIGAYEYTTSGGGGSGGVNGSSGGGCFIETI